MNVFYLVLPKGRLSAIDYFLEEDEKRPELELKKRQVFLTTGAMKKMRDDPYLTERKHGRVWIGQQVVLDGKEYPQMWYLLDPEIDLGFDTNNPQLHMVFVNAKPVYFAKRADEGMVCIITTEEEQEGEG